MSIRLTSRAVRLAVAALAVSGLVVGKAQAGGKERGRPIDFSLPRSDEVTTNLHQLTSKKDSLKQLEEDLYKPLESFAPQSSLDGVTAPPPRAPSTPAIQSKRLKELLERRRNWVFMTPEDLLAAPTIEDILKTPQHEPDGQEKKQLPTLERYFERLSNKRGGSVNLLQSKGEDLFGPASKSKPGEDVAERDDSNLPNGLRESAEALKQLFQRRESDSPFAQSEKRRNLVDTFGVSGETLSKEQVQAHKKFMDDYNALLDPTWHPPAVATPNAFSVAIPDVASPIAKPAEALPSSLSPVAHTGIEAQMDITSPQLGPVGLQDVTAQALGQSRSALPMPLVEAPRVPPPAPMFAAPKRAF